MPPLRTLILSILLVPLSFATAFAVPTAGELLATYDYNGNDALGTLEIRCIDEVIVVDPTDPLAVARQIVERYDTDGNRQLDESELEAAIQQLYGGWPLNWHRTFDIPTEPGSYELYFHHNGQPRRILLVIPESYQHGTSSSGAPVLLGFHGHNQKPNMFFEEPGLYDLMQERGFIGAFPQALDYGNGRSWNVTVLPSNDQQFVLALVDALKRALRCDARRVYATGFSNGAMFTHLLASQTSGVFAAFAPVCGAVKATSVDGNVWLDIPTPVGRPPVLMFHGYKDVRVPYGGGIDDKQDNIYAPASHTLQFWVGNNGLDPGSLDLREPNPDTCIEYYPGDALHPEVALVTGRRAAHVWVDRARWGPEPVVWLMDFFDRHRLP